MRVGEPDAGGFDEEAKLVGVRERRLAFGCRGRARQRSRFLLSDDRLVEGAVRQTNAALKALGQRTRAFEDDGQIEVSRQGHLLADGERQAARGWLACRRIFRFGRHGLKRSRANQPCLVTVSVGTPVPEMKMGRIYLRPKTGT